MRHAALLFLFFLLPLSVQAAQSPQIPIGALTPEVSKLRDRALGGDGYAQLRLGYIYEHGDGAKQDYIEADYWYSLAARNTDLMSSQMEDAQIAQIAQSTLESHLSPKTKDDIFRRKVDTWRKMAANGNAGAMSDLGEVYMKGLNGSPDYKESIAWYRRGAELGDSLSMASIAYLYEKGLGVEQSWEESYYWNNLSATRDAAFAPDWKRERVVAHLTPDQISAVDKRVQAWKSETEFKLTMPRTAEDNDYSLPPFKFKSPDAGVIPNQATAIEVAEAILKPIYGDETIKNEEPFVATLKGNVWSVAGTLKSKNGHAVVGGTAVIELSKSTGRVVRFTHFE